MTVPYKSFYKTNLFDLNEIIYLLGNEFRSHNLFDKTNHVKALKTAGIEIITQTACFISSGTFTKSGGIGATNLVP